MTDWDLDWTVLDCMFVSCLRCLVCVGVSESGIGAGWGVNGCDCGCECDYGYEGVHAGDCADAHGNEYVSDCDHVAELAGPGPWLVD